MFSELLAFYIKYFGNACIPIAFSVPIYLLSAPALLLVVLYRQLVISFAKFTRPDLTPFEVGLDGIYTTEPPEHGFLNTTISLVIDKEITSSRIREMFQNRIFPLKNENGEKIYPKLTQYYTSFMGYAFWARDLKFDLQNHVQDYNYENLLQLPAPSDITTLKVVLSKLIQLPWKPHQSHWEVLVVPNFSHDKGQSSRKTLLIFRIDHGLCDGYSLVGLLRNLFQSPFLMPGLARNERLLTPWEKFTVLLKLPYVMLLPMVNFSQENNFDRSKFSEDFICDISEPFKNDQIKSIKRRIGVEFASVMHGGISAALSYAYNMTNNIPPKSIEVTSVFPLTKHPGGVCNHWVSCTLEFPYKINESPADRIRRTDSVIKETERKLSNYTYNYCMRLLSLLPVRMGRTIVSMGTQLGPVVDVTSLPCTSSREFVDNGEIIDTFFVLNPNSGIGILVSSWGVNKNQRICFNMVGNVFGSRIPSGILSSTFMQELGALEREQ